MLLLQIRSELFLYTALNALIEAGIHLEEELAAALSVPFEKAASKTATKLYVEILESLPNFHRGKSQQV